MSFCLVKFIQCASCSILCLLRERDALFSKCQRRMGRTACLCARGRAHHQLDRGWHVDDARAHGDPETQREYKVEWEGEEAGRPFGAFWSRPAYRKLSRPGLQPYTLSAYSGKMAQSQRERMVWF